MYPELFLLMFLGDIIDLDSVKRFQLILLNPLTFFAFDFFNYIFFRIDKNPYFWINFFSSSKTSQAGILTILFLFPSFCSFFSYFFL